MLISISQYQQIVLEVFNTDFNANPSGGNGDDMMKLMATSRNCFLKVNKKWWLN